MQDFINIIFVIIILLGLLVGLPIIFVKTIVRRAEELTKKKQLADHLQKNVEATLPIAAFGLLGVLMSYLHRNGRRPSPLRILVTVWGVLIGIILLFFIYAYLTR